MEYTILCIDDDETGLLLRKLMLEGEGYRVLVAREGNKGLELLHDKHVDAVILDYRMPGLNGAEVATRIRQARPDMPIVMLSGYADEVPDPAMNLVNAFITKGEAPERLLQAIAANLAVGPGARITILNVDDHPEHRYAITRVLTKAGFNVIEARTGREALQLALCQPGLVILDINLPDMLGFDVCRRLKEHPLTREVPVIHISATYEAQYALQQSVKSGAVRFLEHPTNLSDLVNIVQAELRS